MHRATNMPLKTMIEVDPKTSLLKVSLTQSEKVLSSSSNIDVHHYHVKPYTVKKPQYLCKSLRDTYFHSVILCSVCEGWELNYNC